MRLLTHNMLLSNIKGVANGFSLHMEVERWQRRKWKNLDFLLNIFLKIELKALLTPLGD